MPILFSAVADDKNVLAHFASCDGNFIEITNEVLTRLSNCDDKKTYYHGPYLIHYILQNRHLYFCITDKTCQRSRAFLFLNQLQRRFIKEGKANFSKAIEDEMYRYSEDYSTITVMHGELDQLNTIGVESSERILGEKMLFVNNIENVSYASVSYVGKTPERMSVTQELETSKESIEIHVNKSKTFVVVIIGVLLIFASSTVYIVGPVSCIVIFSVLAYCLFANCKLKRTKEQ